MGMFFVYIILFNVPIVFILITHHVTLNESVDFVNRASTQLDDKEFHQAINASVNEATHISKNEYMKSVKPSFIVKPLETYDGEPSIEIEERKS